MASYQIDSSGALRRKSDGAVIPPDMGNTDYRTFLASGETPDPYVEPPEETARRQRKAAFDADATRADLLSRLALASPAQISSYVDANMTNLAEARALVKKMLLVMAAI